MILIDVMFSEHQEMNFSNCKERQVSRLSSRIHVMSPICKARKKIALVSTESVEEDEENDDFDEQFGIQSWSDDENCSWLSSGSVSHSSSFDDYIFSKFLDLSLDELLKSGLFWGKAITFFDGSMVDPIEEACLFLEKISLDEEKILLEDLQEQEVVTWLPSPSCGYSCTDSDNFDTRSSFRSNFDSTSLSWDFETAGDFRGSLVNLDLEDSKWISDADSDFDYLHSDFPSPSFKSNWDSEDQCCNSSVSSLTEVKHKSSLCSSSDCVSEAVDLENFDTDQPLFWPSDQKSEWGSEGKWDFFIMSPRKEKYKVENSSKSFRIRFQNPKLDLNEGCKRRLVFGSRSKPSKILDLKHENGNEEVRRISTMPSRFASMKVVPIDMEDHDVIEQEDENVGVDKLMVKLGSFLEDDFRSNDELFSIEKMLGLDEFDGHEGVESEFNKDDFSLDESL